MPASPSISSSELDVMTVIWALDEAGTAVGAADVLQALSETHDWSDKTIRTMLARLVSKQVLHAEPDGRRYLYRPLISREAHQRRAVRSLSRRLFKGRAAPLLSFLAEEDGLTEADIAEIEALIQDLKS